MNPFYASTGTRKLHIINPENRAVMLCSSKLAASIPEFKITDHDERIDHGIRSLPLCKNCQKKADKAGLVEDTTPEPLAHVVEPPRETEFVTVAATGGKVHHARATDDEKMIPLCRESHGIHQYTLWYRVNAPLSCSHCVSYEKGRAAARAKYNATLAESPEQPEQRVGTSSDAPELVAVAELLNQNEYTPVTLTANPTITVHGTGYFVAPAWDDKLRVAMLTDEVIMRGHDMLPSRWETILIGAGYRVAERHPNALIVVPPTPKTAIPCGHYSEGQARLVAAALTGDTDTVRGRLDEIAAADDQGTTHGTLAEHADDPTTREILSVLDNDGDLEAAEITGDDLTAETVDGVVAVPRPERGAVYVYWYTNGSRRTGDDRAPAELGQIRRTLEGAGYRVAPRERGSLAVRVLLPTRDAGTGVEPRNAGHTAVNAAAAALGEAGLFLAHLTGDHDNATTPAANGYVVTDHNPDTVWVLHLADGSTRDPHTGQYPRYKLVRAAAALTDQGWDVQSPDEWTWRLWARRSIDPTVHYRRTLADHGAVCGAAALSANDPGMSATPGAVTCPNCQDRFTGALTAAGLPRRTHNADRIGQAGRRWLAPRPRVDYHRSLGWSIDGRRFSDMGEAVTHLVGAGEPRKNAFEKVAREQMNAMSADLPDGVTLYEDDRLGGYGYACTRALCTKRAGGFDYPGGAMHSARAHLMASHPMSHGLPSLIITWPRYE